MGNVQLLIRQYYRIQKHRVAFGNQVRELEEEDQKIEPFDDYHGRMKAIENDIKGDIEDAIKEQDIWQDFLKDVKGIGPILGAALWSMIDIRKAKHVSSLWKYAGQAPDSKRKKGEKLDYNPELKKVCWKIGESFIKTNSPYKEIYDARKEYEKDHSPDLTDGHQHNRAKRYMVKEFLKDLWLTWREMEGLEVTPPYAVAKLDHHDKTKD